MERRGCHEQQCHEQQCHQQEDYEEKLHLLQTVVQTASIGQTRRTVRGWLPKNRGFADVKAVNDGRGTVRGVHLNRSIASRIIEGPDVELKIEGPEGELTID